MPIYWLVFISILIIVLPVSASEAPDQRSSLDANGEKEAAKPVDRRFHSPRATVRSFLIAMNQTEDDPHKIDEAVACLDLSGVPSDRKGDGGRFAYVLEIVLRSTNIPTIVIPDNENGQDCEVGEGKDITLKLHRMADGRWLFSSKTLLDLPRMRLLLWQKAVAASKGKDTADVPSDFRSPYAMFHTFMDAFKKGDLDTAAKCLDLSEIPDPARQIIGRELAFKLKAVLDRSIFVIFQDVPDSSAGVPLQALVHKEGRIVAERQSEGTRKGQWLFNRSTIQSVDPLYDFFETKPILPEIVANGQIAFAPSFRLAPGLWLRQRIPDALKYRLDFTEQFSLALYQLLGIFLLIALVVPIYKIIAWALSRGAHEWRRTRGETISVAEAGLEYRGWARATGMVVALWVLIQGLTTLDLRIGVAGVILAVLVPAFWLTVFLAAFQLIDPILKLIAGPSLKQEGASTLAAMGYPVMSLLLKIVVLLAGLATLLNLFEFDVGTILAGLGIGGIAFALAAQDTLKNFFGSIMLIADRTFRVGDLVKIGGNEGVVESVGLRTTRIRGLDDSLLTIPNSDLTTAHVTNFGARRFRRFRTKLTVDYATTPDQLIQFRDGILNLIRSHPQVRQQKYEVAVNDLSDSGIDILIQVFFELTDGHAELLARDTLILDILRLAERIGIAFDAPTVMLERQQPAPNGQSHDDAASPSPK